MRTLVFAYKPLDGMEEDDYNVSLDDAFFESDLILLGATGVEDML